MTSPDFIFDSSTLQNKSWYFIMSFRNVLQLLFAPGALEKESLEGRGDLYADTVKEIVEVKRKGLFSAFFWIFAWAMLGIIAALAVNYVCTVPSNSVPWNIKSSRRSKNVRW
jgi:hypothetical protein